MFQHLKIYCLAVCLLFAAKNAAGQLTISGTVYDSSKIIPVKGVLVKSSSGNSSQTDSAGHYEIVCTDMDSLTFIYRNKPTAKFAVKQIENIGSFDISLHIRLAEKFKTMKEVTIFSKSFRQDSIENRLHYAKLFNYQKPGIKVNSSSYSGAAGMDLDAFINMFRFRRNRQLRHMQERLVEQEKENFINYRFNKLLVKRITRLDGKDLDSFMTIYRPEFEFTQTSSTTEFYQYILNASYQFKKEMLMQKAKK